MSSFGRMLRSFRLRASLSQRKLAQSASIDTSYISRVESGERPVTSRDLAIRLAELLGLTASETELWLLSAGYAAPAQLDDAEPQISRLLEALEETGREEHV